MKFITHIKKKIHTHTLVRGFTILESLFAIFILSLAIAGVFTIVQQGLSQATDARQEVRAYYLAQEGIEIIRNRRDANQIDKIVNNSSNGWMHGIAEVNDPCEFNKVCRADVDSVPVLSLNRCGDLWDTCPEFNINSATGLYTYNPGVYGGGITREIMIEPIVANEVSVTVRIVWRRGLLTRELKIKTYLFNWI